MFWPGSAFVGRAGGRVGRQPVDVPVDPVAVCPPAPGFRLRVHRDGGAP
jgi:hypothetical protein